MASPRADLARVFDTAFRSDSARNRDQAGGGLGLPIARGLADLVGGTLDVDNVGNGCRFLLTVPLDESPTSPAGLAAHDVPDRDAPSVSRVGERAIDA